MIDPTKLLPLRYTEPVYRPPSEATALILPVTDGCSWNRCAFCEMYTAPQKKFRARPQDEVLATIAWCGEQCALGNQPRRVFLADGDAMVLPTRRLLLYLQAIRHHLPAVHRVSSYCLPRNVAKKSVAELRELADAGLKLVYVGAESGCDAVLAAVNKGESFASTVSALDKLQAAGITRSVMILNGLGGSAFSQSHVQDSARLVNTVQPEFLATLVVSFPQGEARFRSAFADWQPLSPAELLMELREFLSALHLQRTVFRSDHASNWLALKGVLNADKESLLAKIDAAQNNPSLWRPIWARGI